MLPYPIIWGASVATAQPVDRQNPVSAPLEASAGKWRQVTVRVLAALVMIPPVLACIYFGYPVFNVFVAVMVALMAWEWRRLVSAGDFGVAGATFGVFLVAAVLAGSWGHYIIAFALLGVLAFLFILKGILGGTARWMVLGVFYIGLPAMALLWLRGDGDNGRNIIYWLFVLVWAADTGAYIAGRLIGGPKLAPSISPNKTWAGLAGCVLSAALVGVGVAYLAGSDNYLVLAALSAVIGVVSQGGDLVESAIKRHFGVKDSSHLIPGHGGVLDRVDALLAAIVFAALIRMAFGGSIVQWS